MTLEFATFFESSAVGALISDSYSLNAGASLSFFSVLGLLFSSLFTLGTGLSFAIWFIRASISTEFKVLWVFLFSVGVTDFLFYDNFWPDF